MSIVDAVKSVFSNYANFQGRARRSEYWYWVLVYGIVSGVLSAVAKNVSFVGIIAAIVSLACLIPSIAVDVRRLHDIGKSGWWLLLSLIPVVGAIILLVWSCKDSEPGENQYGPNPKA